MLSVYDFAKYGHYFAGVTICFLGLQAFRDPLFYARMLGMERIPTPTSTRYVPLVGVRNWMYAAPILIFTYLGNMQAANIMLWAGVIGACLDTLLVRKGRREESKRLKTGKERDEGFTMDNRSDTRVLVEHCIIVTIMLPIAVVGWISWR